ncbi:MAG: hypothetical protein MR598_05960 [Erysipelotrichaceae bacterium]|nr:hypothetical protein [Erysipelotrichaceae bacterium]
MFKFIKNKFLFIILISIATLAILIIGALSLYKDTSSVFASDGYILETTTKTNQKYYFSANTKYKENVDNQITFSDNDSNKVSVDPASFVHYLNGNITFLQKGALVNLADINSPMVSYYNITTENTIVRDNNQYTVTSNDKKINIESFIGRISDKKYLIAGKDISIKVPKVEERIAGEYFEILFIEEGIVKIDNQEASYQVTAQDSYVYVGDNITISLGDGKIFYDGDAKMLLSQITINGDENIDLDVEKENGTGGGTGTGEGSGSGEGESGEDGDNFGEGTGEGIGEEGDGTGTGNGGNGTGGDNTTASPQIELIEANVTSTTIDLSLQLNNASFAKGTVVAYLTNVATGAREYAKNIELVNGTFKIVKESLSPSTDYALTIVETGSDNEKQYFQKTFKTKDLGITLEKVYATEDSLSYNIIFDENTDVTMAHISIYDNNGSNETIEPNEFTVSKEDLNNTVTFSGLKSNTSYSINIDTVWINNAAYSNVYTINRIDTTLKKTPKISGVSVDANAEEVKFTVKLNNVEDKDKSIISYTYNIYLADDITIENMDPVVQYSVTKNDADALVLNLNEIDELKTGVDYRCKIVAEYNDNDMIREVSTDYSGNFLIKSKPNISFELESATMNKITGTISLIDANCTVPINGRSCSSAVNNFTLRYYKLKEEETTENDTTIIFDSKKLTSNITLSDLASNTTYAVKVFGNYYDDDNVLHTNVQIGDTFYVTTDKSENLHLEIIGDNISGQNKDGTENSANVVTFDAKLTAPQDSTIKDEISTITLNLYSGRYNTKDKLIGSYTITDRTGIEDLFSNITIKNSLFTDVTNNRVGKIDSLEKLIKITNNSTGTLNGSYTVEVEDVYDSTGKNKITVEDNVYTFNLTASYYLDTRIETNPKDTYITVTPITKENLTEDEYTSLAKTVKNLDDLNEDTVVGINIENSLSDIFVDSAFTYEKVIVNYTIYNETTKKEIKTISIDMGNKYQPKNQTVYLDSSELDDGKTTFTRGYKYKIGYHLSFITEDGSNPTYTNDKLYKTLPIERQTPIYTQYISTSNSNGITYRYSFKDIDGALANRNFYYTLGEDTTYQSINESLNPDGEYHDVTIPITNNSTYSLYYAKKNTNNDIDYISISTYDFETEYNYNNEVSYTIVNDHDNVLKLRLENNEITNRAVAFKVVISAKEKNNITDYTRYFLASKLSTSLINIGTHDDEGSEITEEYKYIAIDYANISKFMGYEMIINVYSYYDSGLVGLDQKFDNGLILKNRETNKILNIHNGANTTSTLSEDTENMGIYFLKEPYSKTDETIYIYNKLQDTNKYNPLLGANYIETPTDNNGIKFNISFTNAGILLNYGKKDYLGYNARVLKEANLKTDNNTYKFNTIVPTIKVTTNNKNTINSIKINITPNGIYGTKQFIKDGVSHNKVYIEIYKEEECTNKLDTITSNITITGNDETGYSATIDQVEYKNLDPATTYYFKVFAYIDGTYTQLYDSSSTTSYITKVYDSTTLDASGILSSIRFAIEPKRYNGESSEKELSWKLGLKNTENYKLRFELYEPDGTTTKTDPETGEEITVPNFKPVNFDGTPATSCDINKNGTSSTGYVDNCYISVPSSEVTTINNTNEIYKFSGNNFVFGGNYYKLVVYAIPYTNNAYDESKKIVLYENESLTTTGRITTGGFTYDIIVPTLEEAEFSLGNSLSAGHNDNEGYYISFTPTITDTYKVIKYGTYTIKLTDEKGTEIAKKTNVDANEINNKIKFTGLSSNTLYYVELSYETYRNNVGFTEKQKTTTTPFTDFTYTPIDAGITLGTITAGQSSAKTVTLTYNGSSNLSDNITRVDYTISLKGGSSKTTGTYKVDSDTPSIFTITSDKTPKLIIDTSNSKYSSNTSFTFKTGNTYIITTQYYYGNDQILTDQETGNTTHTTILNL